MQYPPQQQLPTHTPSEDSLSEQPQAYPPRQQVYAPHYQSSVQGQEMTWPPMQAQEIVIYPNRRQAIMRTTFCTVCLVLLILWLIGISLFLFILSSSPGAPSLASGTALLGTGLAFMLAVIAFLGWATWDMAQLFLKPTPLLIINRQGITVCKMPILSGSGFFIPWHEIEAIHASTFIYKYLCIRPKDTKQFLKHFNILERFSRQSNAIIGLPPLVVPQVFLKKTVRETLQQLQTFYAHELETHHIRLWP